jgi:putative transposase
MPRVARIVGTGYPHHVVQRGNNREKVFLNKADYRTYLSYLERYSTEKKVAILAYCLMSNHVHLLVRPVEENALSKMMQGIALCYTQYFNRKNKRTGRLWECRYHSTLIDEETYLWAVSKYIDSNPVRAGIVEDPAAYRYSSARAHLFGEADPFLKEPLFDEGEMSEYRRFMRRMEDKQVLEEIRRHTRLGKPLGDGGFLGTLSKRLGHRLVFRPKGRPRTKEQAQ